MNKIDRQKANRQIRRQFSINFLGGRCRRCGTNSALQFDHVDPKSKRYLVSALFSSSWSKLITELTKCQLLCRKCHNLKTITELGQIPATQQHGTLTSYTHGKCRCEKCRNFWNEKAKIYKRKKLLR